MNEESFSSTRPQLPTPPVTSTPIQSHPNSNSNSISNFNQSHASSNNKKPSRRPLILPNDIKCVLLQGFGSIKQLKAISIPRPKPGDGEILVHVKSW
jgi:hypothetical protein